MIQYDKEEHKQQYDKNMLPYEMFFLHLGAEVLSNASGFLTAAPDKSISKLGGEIQNTVSKIKASKDINDLKRLKKELERLESIGRQNLVGTEGIVFPIGDKLYKLTGIFTPIHRILSILKYKKPVVKEISPRYRPVDPKSIRVASYDDLKRLAESTVIREGGNAVFANSTLKNKYLDDTIKNAFKIWGLKGINYEIVGSKHKPEMGDIDVAIDTADLGKLLGADPIDRIKFWSNADSFFKSNTPDEIEGTPAYKLNKGLDQIHISTPVVGEPGKFVQVDLMLGNVGWMKDALSGSVDSKYKALYRNLLLVNILSHSHEPTQDPNTLKKYQINWKKGLQSVNLMTKNGKIEKSVPEPVTSKMDDVAEFLFGPGTRFSDISTFEKLYSKVESPSFRYKNKKDEILSSFNKTLEKMKLPPVEI